MWEQSYFKQRWQQMQADDYEALTKRVKSNRATADERKRANAIQQRYNEQDAYFAPLLNAQVVVSLSGGVSSAVAADIAIKMYGADNVDLVFCDTLIEDPDLYRFMNDLEQHWQKKITRLQDGRTPYQIASDEGETFIPNQLVATCTRRLKIFLFRDYIQSYLSPVAVALGMSANEQHRMHSPQLTYNNAGHLLINPMSLKDHFVFDPKRYVKDMGVEIPHAYRYGFKHNNCLGDNSDNPAGCVKFGQGDWIRMLIHYPNGFEATARWERERIALRRERGEKIHTFLRKTVDGQDVQYTLDDLKQDYLASNQQLRLWDLQGELDGESCRVECGITLTDDAA